MQNFINDLAWSDVWFAFVAQGEYWNESNCQHDVEQAAKDFLSCLERGDYESILAKYHEYTEEPEPLILSGDRPKWMNEEGLIQEFNKRI